MKNHVIIIGILAVLVTGCAGNRAASEGAGTTVIRASGPRPAWVDGTESVWEKDDRVFFRSRRSIRGDERENGGLVMATNDNCERLLREIYGSIKAATDEAQLGLSEQAELVLGQVRSGKWEGPVYGLRAVAEYSERYLACRSAGDCTERIDCWVLSSVSRADYNRTRSAIVDRVAAMDPRVREAIVRKQVDFFVQPLPGSPEPCAPSSGEHPAEGAR
jgi:hypothetical protein